MNLVRNSRRDVSPLSQASTSSDSPELNSLRSRSSVIFASSLDARRRCGWPVALFLPRSHPIPPKSVCSCGALRFRGHVKSSSLVAMALEKARRPDGALFNLALDRLGETQVMARGEMFVERGLILVDFVEDETSWLLWIEEHVETLATRLRALVKLSR